MIEKWDITIPELTGDEVRSAYICLPEAYTFDTNQRFPVLYMFDGHNLFFDTHATYGKSWGLKMKTNEKATIGNIYRLNGRVPLLKAIPFGLQHVLAMFVSNLTPITMIGLASGLSGKELAVLLQNAMFVAGIATLIQLYPVWKVGAKLPIVMGVSFTVCLLW